MDLTVVFASLLFLIIGGGVGFFIRHRMVVAETNQRKQKGDEIIDKAKKDASDIKYRARKEAKDIVNEEVQHHFNINCRVRVC